MLILASLPELHVRPALLGQVEIDLAGRDVDETVPVIERQVVMRLLAKILEHIVIFGLHPACRRDIDRLELALDLVLVLETVRHNVELQGPDGAEDKVVVTQRFE